MVVTILNQRVQNECFMAVMQARMGLVTEIQAREAIEIITGGTVLAIQGNEVRVLKSIKDYDLGLTIEMNCIVPIN